MATTAKSTAPANLFSGIASSHGMMPRFYGSSRSRDSAPSLDGILRDSWDRDGGRLLFVCRPFGSRLLLFALLSLPRGGQVGQRLGCANIALCHRNAGQDPKEKYQHIPAVFR